MKAVVLLSLAAFASAAAQRAADPLLPLLVQAFGTTAGDVYGSADEGDSWQSLVSGLPKLMSVTAARLG